VQRDGDTSAKLGAMSPTRGLYSFTATKLRGCLDIGITLTGKSAVTVNYLVLSESNNWMRLIKIPFDFQGSTSKQNLQIFFTGQNFADLVSMPFDDILTTRGIDSREFFFAFKSQMKSESDFGDNYYGFVVGTPAVNRISPFWQSFSTSELITQYRAVGASS